jgi:hypothetical protein
LQKDIARTTPETRKPPDDRGFFGARYWDRTSTDSVVSIRVIPPLPAPALGSPRFAR